MVRELLESQKIKASGVSSALSVKPGRSSSHLPEKLKIKIETSVVIQKALIAMKADMRRR